MNVLVSIYNYFIEPYRTITRRRRTVRYAFPMVIMAAVVLSAATIQSTNTATLTIETSDSQVRAGELLRLDVFVEAALPVNTVDIAIDLPAQLVEVNSIDTGQSVITLWTNDPYIENNTVYLQGGTFRRGFTGKHLIATIDVTAKANGIAQFTVAEADFYAGDGSGDTVSSGGQTAAEVYIGSTVPLGVAERGEGGGAFSGEATVMLVTDIDGDGQVTLSDVSRFLTAWRNKDVVFDFNNDGRMTFRDFGIILTHSFFR